MITINNFTYTTLRIRFEYYFKESLFMKKTLVILASLLSINAYAIPAANANLDNLTIIKLNDIQENHLSVRVAYPYKNGSGTCSIIIRTRYSVDLKKLADKFVFIQDISGSPVIPNSSTNGALMFALVEDAFVDGIKIETKDGKSIAENIASVLPPAGKNNNDVGVVGGVCA